MPECSSASICGQLDRHGNEKKEVQELGKRKLKAEVELKALKADLSVKQTLSKNVSQSFEARIHDALIRTNLGKCLTENNRPKEGVILAYTYILKKYYGGRIPDAASLELENEIFQTVIQSHEEKQLTTRSKNNVIKELENRGIKWPNVSHDTQQALQFTSGYPLNASPMFYNPAWYQQPANFPFGGYSVTPTRIDVTGRHPLASPAPPPQPPLPPLPDDLMPGSTTEVGNDSAE